MALSLIELTFITSNIHDLALVWIVHFYYFKVYFVASIDSELNLCHTLDENDFLLKLLYPLSHNCQ